MIPEKEGGAPVGREGRRSDKTVWMLSAVVLEKVCANPGRCGACGLGFELGRASMEIITIPSFNPFATADKYASIFPLSTMIRW